MVNLLKKNKCAVIILLTTIGFAHCGKNPSSPAITNSTATLINSTNNESPNVSYAPPLMGDNLKLSNCGKIIGHEMGMWDFFQLGPSPTQVDKVLWTDLKWVKISLRRMKDGVWIVNHDDNRTVFPHLLQAEKFVFADHTWDEVESMKKNFGSYVPVYKLSEYINRDTFGKLCWMFSPKEAPDLGLLQQISSLNILKRTLILSRNPDDTEWWFTNTSAESGVQFAARVGTNTVTLEGQRRYFNRIYTMEIDKSDNTAALIQEAHRDGLTAYVDSMRYDLFYEIDSTACKSVFNLGADLTQTNRPLGCKAIMGPNY